MTEGFYGPPSNPHERVAVLSHFDGTWCQGFEIADVAHEPNGHDRIRVRRLSDGRILPAWFDSDDVLPDRH